MKTKTIISLLIIIIFSLIISGCMDNSDSNKGKITSVEYNIGDDKKENTTDDFIILHIDRLGMENKVFRINSRDHNLTYLIKILKIGCGVALDYKDGQKEPIIVRQVLKIYTEEEWGKKEEEEKEENVFCSSVLVSLVVFFIFTMYVLCTEGKPRKNDSFSRIKISVLVSSALGGSFILVFGIGMGHYILSVFIYFIWFAIIYITKMYD